MCVCVSVGVCVCVCDPSWSKPLARSVVCNYQVCNSQVSSKWDYIINTPCSGTVECCWPALAPVPRAWLFWSIALTQSVFASEPNYFQVEKLWSTANDIMYIHVLDFDVAKKGLSSLLASHPLSLSCFHSFCCQCYAAFCTTLSCWPFLVLVKPCPTNTCTCTQSLVMWKWLTRQTNSPTKLPGSLLHLLKVWLNFFAVIPETVRFTYFTNFSVRGFSSVTRTAKIARPLMFCSL